MKDMEVQQPSRKRKSVTINTSISTNNSPMVDKLPKSILKKAKKSRSNEIAETVQNGTTKESDSTDLKSSTRLHNIKELNGMEKLQIENMSCTLEDLSDNEDVWIMEVPNSMTLEKFSGKKINFNSISKLKVNKKRYYTVPSLTSDINAIFIRKNSEYKTVNIQPRGYLRLQKKLSTTPIEIAVEVQRIENDHTSRPKLLKRDPILGVLEKRKKKSRKSKSLNVS